MKEIETFNYGRDCLQFIVKKLNIQETYLPFYTCPVVWQTLRGLNCNIRFYHIDRNFMPVYDFPANSFIIYTNYFGVSAKNVELLSLKYPNLIVDNAQSFYMPLNYGVAGFNSPRKFFNIKNSAVLNIGDNTYGKNLVSKREIEIVKQKRIENFNLIHSKLQSSNELCLNLTSDDVPMIYPYLNYDESLIKKLKKNHIEPDRFWNPLPINTQEGIFQRFLIPIPISQYTKENEILKILDILLS